MVCRLCDIRLVSLCAGYSISVRACSVVGLTCDSSGRLKVSAPLSLACVRVSRLWLLRVGGTVLCRTGAGLANLSDV